MSVQTPSRAINDMALHESRLLSSQSRGDLDFEFGGTGAFDGEGTLGPGKVPFASMRTDIFSLMIAAIHICLIVTCFIAVDWWHLSDRESWFNFCSILHVWETCLIFLLTLLQQYFHERYRKKGYFEIVRKLRNPIYFPFLVSSFGNIVIVILYAAFPPWMMAHGIRPIHCLQFLVVVEGLLDIAPISYHIWSVWQFNRTRAEPDPFRRGRSDFGSPGAISPSFAENSSRLADALEDMLDTVYFLNTQRAILSREILNLRGRYGIHGHDTAVHAEDVEHIMQEKESQIRILTGEKQRMESELTSTYRSNEDKDRTIGGLRDRVRELHKHTVQLAEERDEWSKHARDMEDNWREQQAAVNENMQQIAEMNRELNALQEENKDLKKDNLMRENVLESLRGKIEAMDDQQK
jgi:hypothetical protein